MVMVMLDLLVLDDAAGSQAGLFNGADTDGS